MNETLVPLEGSKVLILSASRVFKLHTGKFRDYFHIRMHSLCNRIQPRVRLVRCALRLRAYRVSRIATQAHTVRTLHVTAADTVHRWGSGNECGKRCVSCAASRQISLALSQNTVSITTLSHLSSCDMTALSLRGFSQLL